MRRTFKALFAVFALALAIPGAALAHGRRGHHGGRHLHGVHSHHRHHHGAKGARVLHFRPTASTTSTTVEGEEGTGSGETPPAPESAGVVVSFEAEVLTIKLNDGTLVKGKVTEDTQLLCMPKEPEPAVEGSEGEEDHGSGDDREGGDRDEGVSPEGSEGKAPEGEEGTSEHGDQSSQPSAHDSGFDGSSHDGGWSGDGGGELMQPCETTALTPEATVREAELRLGSTGAVWEKVVLLQ